MTTPPKDSSTPETSDAPKKDDAPGNSTPAAATPKKKIDPWHFGAHTVPPQLRAELSAMTLPESPEERRYRRPNAESTSDSPAPPVDTSRADPTVMIPRVAMRRDRRIVVGVVIGAALLLLLAAALLRPNGSPANPVAQSPTGKPSPPASPAPAKPAAASANPASEGAGAADSPPLAPSSPVTAGTPENEGAKRPSKRGSLKDPSTPRPAAPTEASPATPAPPPSATPRPSSGRLIPADD
jgi:hypothetical protein